eukprot:TRINITY_DN55391_c0_g1_i1.p1 TRINITY_DN55391_c0_g1~~TRINITY_DN55391_c0_g1_i1.p1  ORF type:complete len:415 (-),score=56.94 TRINITY_DN55391_c0_g1_i1:79-1323(-)
MGCAANDDGFQVVGKKGKAVPKTARCDVGAIPTKVVPLSASSLSARSPPWSHADRPKLSVAPMMEWTDEHYRTFARLMTKRTLLFTEMIPADVVVAAQKDGSLSRLLAFDETHRPLAVQIGGSCPETMAEAANLCAQAGFDEVNLNVGCPSPAVTFNNYGACLMKNPNHVAAIVSSVCKAYRTLHNPPALTVKHRLGVDDHDSWEELVTFVEVVAAAGVTHFSVHARKALLGVLSPEGNRTIPPLRHEWVFALVQRFPHLSFELNGGVLTLDAVKALLAQGPISGVMVGRAAYNTPWAILAKADSELFKERTDPAESRNSVLDKYLDYAAAVFQSRQRMGEVPTEQSALELERILAAPISHLYEDVSPDFGPALLAALEAGRTSKQRAQGGLPSFYLRKAAMEAVSGCACCKEI